MIQALSEHHDLIFGLDVGKSKLKGNVFKCRLLVNQNKPCTKKYSPDSQRIRILYHKFSFTGYMILMRFFVNSRRNLKTYSTIRFGKMVAKEDILSPIK